MPRINEAFLNLKASYLFAEVKKRTQAYRAAHPDARLIDLGIGDVTLPLPPAVVQALEEASREQGRAETLKGYGPYIGYEFLRGEIAAHDFGGRGVPLGADEVFVSDGGKSDAANIQEIFAQSAVVRVRCTSGRASMTLRRCSRIACSSPPRPAAWPSTWCRRASRTTAWPARSAGFTSPGRRRTKASSCAANAGPSST